MKNAVLTFRTNVFSKSNPSYHDFLQRSWKKRGNNLTADNYKLKGLEQELFYDFLEVSERGEEIKAVEDERLPTPAKIWVHMSCSLWIPELLYEDKINCSKIKGFEKIPKG